MSNCPAFLSGTGRAGSAGEPCRFRPVLFTRFALSSETQPPLTKESYLGESMAHLPKLPPYDYTLRILRDNGFLYLFDDMTKTLEAFSINQGQLENGIFAWVNAQIHKVWAAFSEVEWTDAVKKRMLENPGAYMQEIELETGTRYVGSGDKIRAMVEEARDATGCLRSIRGWTRRVVGIVDTEPQYTDLTYTYNPNQPKDPYLARRWADSCAEYYRLDLPKELPEDLLLVALHDPMGISRDLATLNRISLETQEAYNQWYEYPATIATFITAMETATKKTLDTADLQWRTEKAIYIGAEKDYNEDYLNQIHYLPPDKPGKRSRIVKGTRRCSTDNVIKSGWWKIEEYYSGRTEERYLNVRRTKEMEIFLKKKDDEGKVFALLQERLLQSWLLWLQREEAFGFKHAFAFYDEDNENSFTSMEGALAGCLCRIDDADKEANLALDVVLLGKGTIGEFFSNITQGGTKKFKFNEHSAALLSTVANALEILSARDRPRLEALFEACAQRLRKEEDVKFPKLPINNVQALLCMAEGLANGTEAETSSPEVKQDKTSGIPLADRLHQATIYSGLSTTAANLGVEFCGQEWITYCYANYSKKFEIPPTASKVLTLLSVPVTTINLGLVASDFAKNQNPSSPDAFYMLVHIRDMCLAVSRATNLHRLEVLKKMLTPKAVKFASKGLGMPLDVVTDGVRIYEFVKTNEKDAAIALGFTVAVYGLLAVGGAPVVMILAVQLGGVSL